MRTCRECLKCVLLLAWLLLGSSSPTLAQPPGPAGGPPPPPAPVTGPLALAAPVKVFIDCSGYWDCDSEYFRTTLTFVDHVRDREVADVHVLITGQATGSGGTEATLTFFGRGPFNGINDVLKYPSPPNAASDVVRSGLVKALKLGLTRYVSHSPAAQNLQINVAAATQATPQAPVKDPWDHWVMRVSVNGNLGGESLARNSSYYGSASASRTTEAWKINFSANAQYRESWYDFGDGEIYTTVSRSTGANALIVKSLTPHWSVGGRTSVSSSTYSNLSSSINVAPAIEYDVFPYADSTRRLLTLHYSIGATNNRYRETTLYDKDQETIGVHTLAIGVSARQPWGQVNTSIDLSQYLTIKNKYRAESWGSVNLKVGKGLSLNVGGGVSWIRDQISLPKGEATRDEVLVRQRQLATSYDYSVFFGLSYTFGSIFNNIVNPRFGSSGGGMTVMYY